MDPYADTALYGRDRIIEMIWESCLSRPGKTQPDLPVVTLVGPPGSGKTAILNHLAARCVRQAAQPFAPVVDLRRSDTPRRGWQVIGGLAYQLSAQAWPQFGRLAFPRTALGRIIVQANVTRDDPEATQAAIEALLIDAAHLDGVADDVGQLVGQMPRLLGLPDLAVLGRLGARVVRSRAVTRLRFHSGMAFYGDVLRHRANNGFPALVELSRLGRETNKDSRAMLDRVMCQAFMADLSENFAHGFRPRNCLVLLDNLDTEVGQDLLEALIGAKAASPTPASPTPGCPLLVVATSRILEPVARISALGGTAAEHPSLWAAMPADVEATFAGWVDARTERMNSWLYPVRLGDLDLETVTRMENARFPDSSDKLAPFVWSLTRGHPWSVRKVLEAVSELGPRSRKVTEQDLQNLLDVRCPGDTEALGDVAVDYFLDDLSALRNYLITWSPARDVITADEAKRAHAADASLPDLIQDKVADCCWLRHEVEGDKRPVLHDLFRRVLLRRLATGRHRTPDASDNWRYVHEMLRRHGEVNARALDQHYHAVAQGDLADAVTHLSRRFDELGVDAWITEFEAISSAPRRPTKQSAENHHANLVEACLAKKPAADELPPTDPHGDRWVTLVGLVAARWIWSDPLGDPLTTLNPVIGNGLRDLARRSPRGAARLIAEARLYEQGKRP